MARDDFSAGTKLELARRVGNRCSNPNCRTITTGPHTDDSKSISVGEASHITAASPGGKRFDASLTPDQRKAISNGIWLCEKCAKLIDTDEERYSVQFLIRWKEGAEDAALADLEGRKNTDDPESHCIRFTVDKWNIWRNRGNLPGDHIIIHEGWGRGDIKYGCTLRFRNDNTWEDQLHNTRVEYKEGDSLVFVDEYAIQREITLPPRTWVSVHIGHGCHKSNEEEIPNADSLWFAAETVGDNYPQAWKIADINFASIRQTD